MRTMHVTPETLGRLARRELDSDELLETLRHFAACEECSRATGAWNDTAGIRTLLGVAADDHLEPLSQLDPYVLGTLNEADREIVDMHLENCASCRREVQDLAAFVHEQTHPVRWTRGLMVAAAIGGGLLLFLGFWANRDRPATRPMASRPAAIEQPAALPDTRSSAVSQTYANLEWQQHVARARESGQLPFPSSLDKLRPPHDVLRGETTTSERTMSPAGIVVDETRPRFSWSRRAAATYTVGVFASDIEVVRSPPLRMNSWRPSRPLARGRTYMWQVEAATADSLEVIPSPPARPPMFAIITEDQHQELEDARRRYPHDHVLYAVLAARSGLRDEALAALRRANPGDLGKLKSVVAEDGSRPGR